MMKPAVYMYILRIYCSLYYVQYRMNVIAHPIPYSICKSEPHRSVYYSTVQLSSQLQLSQSRAERSDRDQGGLKFEHSNYTVNGAYTESRT